MDFTEAERLVASARDKRSKPYANNTRVEKRGDDAYALRLHATDVVTFMRDGRVILRTGGWYTVTTKDRINFASGIRVGSDRGEWYVDNPQPNDPEPPYAHRTVLKPFHALDPGPEPEKPAEGCLAGTVKEEDYERETLVSKRDIESGLTGWTEADIVRPYENSDYFAGYVMKRGRKITAYYADSPHGENVERPSGSINDETNIERCPHCAHFARVHEAWDVAMNGERWGRRAGRGYRQMTEALERYGSREAWQAAYEQDGRDTKEARKRYSEWFERNHVGFVDGITFAPGSDGVLRCIGITSNDRTRPLNAGKLAKEKQSRAKLQRTIKAFVDLAGERLDEGMSVPGPGDCWFCSMHDVNTGEAWGDVRGDDYEHLLSHIEEGYVVPAMLWNAVKEAGYRYPEVILGVDPDTMATMGGRVTTQLGEERPRAMSDSVKRALRKYLTKRLVVGVTPR